MAPVPPALRPPILHKLGGWLSAPWCTPQALSDHAALVESFHVSLPNLDGGLRVLQGPFSNDVPGKAGLAVDLCQRYQASRIVSVGYGHGGGAAPMLHAAELQFGQDMPRAHAFRREARAFGLGGCVLHAAAGFANIMLWPREPAVISEDVVRLRPDVPLRLLRDLPLPPPAKHAPQAAEEDAERRRLAAELTAQTRELARLGAEIERRRRAEAQSRKAQQAALQDVARLQAQIETLCHASALPRAAAQLGLDDRRFKILLRLLHPDMHQNSAEATEITQWINGIRAKLRRPDH